MQRQYNVVPGEDDADVELGEGHETGVIDPETAVSDPLPPVTRTLEEEVDNWDENAMDDWPEEDDGDIGKSNGGGTGDVGNSKPS